MSAFPDLTPDQVAAQIMAKGLTGEWAVLPSQYVLAERFDVGRGTIEAATKRLAGHRVLVKVLINGGRRWRLRPPHRIGGVDSRLTMLALQALAADVVWRDQDEAFRCPLQGDSMHERPFLANSELGHQYGAAWPTIVAIKDELRHQRPTTSSVHFERTGPGCHAGASG